MMSLISIVWIVLVKVILRLVFSDDLGASGLFFNFADPLYLNLEVGDGLHGPSWLSSHYMILKSGKNQCEIMKFLSGGLYPGVDFKKYGGVECLDYCGHGFKVKHYLRVGLLIYYLQKWKVN